MANKNNNGIGNKLKRPPDIQELNKFLDKTSFTIKEELDIWSKFGMLTGSGDYFMYRNKNRAIITSQGKQYNYIVYQVANKDSNIVYTKIIDNENSEVLWNYPGNQWKDNLYWNGEKGEWFERSTIPPLPIYTKEEDAISIIESVVMSLVKTFKKKNLEFLELEQSDFCYSYIGSDNKWHAFYPSTEKLIAYGEKFNKVDFIEFLNSNDYIQLRNNWDTV